MRKAIKICSLFLAVVLLAGISMPVSFAASAKSTTIMADGMNKDRGEGELIYYDSSFGTSTKTNEWGYEVTVDSNNKVTKVGGYNSSIPAGGFVLSGHNTDGEVKRGKELEESIKVGDYVYFNQSGYVITVSDKPGKPSSFITVSTTFNGVNTTRSTDFLIIYDSKGTRTATNEWGYEVIVEKGIVTVMGGNDNQVPDSDKSFVVSGHGKSAEWLKSNIKLGMTVNYDLTSKTISFKYDADSAIYNIDIKIKNIESELNTAKENYRYIDFKTAGEKLDEIKNKFEQAKTDYKKNKDDASIDSVCSEIENSLTDLSKLLSESRTVEYRGVWLRPTQTTAKAVDDYVQQLYDAGINLICIETLYDCTMIMPMPKDSLFVQNPKWKGFDMLQAYIDSCHKRGMELHLWMPIFYVGHKNSSNVALSVASKKPAWMSVSNTGGNYSPSDTQYYQMLSPANKEAKEFLLKTYKYILQNYNIDGFQVDYIRYWENTADCDFGYDKTALDEFEAKYGVRPTYDKSASWWNDWVAFRAQYVTDMVKSIRDLINDVRPSVMLGADVVPKIEDAYNHVYQDYSTWLDKGYLNILHPMSYGEGFEEQISKQVERCGDKVFIAVGLGSYMDELTSADLYRQAKTNNELGTDGSAFFEASSYMSKEMGKELTAGLYKNKAVTPTYDKYAALVKTLEFTKSRIDDVIVPLEGMTSEEADSVKSALDNAIKATSDKKSVNDALSEVEKAINSVSKENAKKILLKDLAYSKKIAGAAEKIPARIDVKKGELKDSSDVSDEASEDTNPPIIRNDKLTLTIIICGLAVVIAAVGAILYVRKKNSKK